MTSKNAPSTLDMAHSEINLVDMPQMKYLGIKARTSTDPKIIGEFFSRAFGELWRHCKSKDILLMRPPFGIYSNYNDEGVDIVAGLPVEESVSGEGDVFYGIVEASKALHVLHLGSYEQLRETYLALEDHLKSIGLIPQNVSIEIYLNDPGEVTPEELRTAIYWPLHS